MIRKLMLTDFTEGGRRNEGGSGMIQLELNITTGQKKYLTRTTDWMLPLVLAHDKTKTSSHYK